MSKCFHPNASSLKVFTSSPDLLDYQTRNGEHQNGQRNFVSCSKSVIKLDKSNETKMRATLPSRLEKSKKEKFLRDSETKSKRTSKEKFLNQSKNKNEKFKCTTNNNGNKSYVNDATDMSDRFKTDKNEVAINKPTWKKNGNNLNAVRLAFEQANLGSSDIRLKRNFFLIQTYLDVQIDRYFFTDSSSSNFRHICLSQSFYNNLQADSDRSDFFQSNTNDKNQNTDVATNNKVSFLVSLCYKKANNMGILLGDGILVSRTKEPENILCETSEINNNDLKLLLINKKSEKILKLSQEKVEKLFLKLDFSRDEILCFEGIAEDSIEEMIKDVNAVASFPAETKKSVTSDYESSETLIKINNFQTRLKRSSSLKINNATSGTSGSKKIVRFADALGLDLADVRTFLDEVPQIPNSAYKYLDSYSTTSNTFFSSLTLVPMFQQPGHQINFMDKVQTQSVCLETVSVTNSSSLSVAGTVRVLNLNFHKSVHVRYSMNNWKTFSDLQATYVPGSCDGSTDKFFFVIYGQSLKAGDKIELALCYSCNGNQYWDNNAGINYSFNCLPETSANGFFSRGNNVITNL